MRTSRCVGGPLDGTEMTIRATTNEFFLIHGDLVLRYNRDGDQFWLDEWSRPITEAEQREVDRLRSEGTTGPIMGQAYW